MSDLKLIPVNIKYYREKIGMKQKDAAQAADITNAYWNWIEKGERLPSLSMLQTMCNVLGISIAQVFEER
jgi:transcriptional regulator with XRE-family HTH domain